MSTRRDDPKALPSTYQEKRRRLALEQQAKARQQTAEKARRLAFEATESDESAGGTQQDGGDVELSDAGTSGLEPAGPEEVEMAQQHQPGSGGRRRRPSAAQQSPTARERAQQLRRHYAEQLMVPEWLIEVPPDLGADWYALPRPEGQRCLVIASGGSTAARLRNGVLAQRFPSQLPGGGGPGGRKGGSDFCILDCIYHQPDETFYVLDLVAWRGFSLYACTSEFRLFWVATKLREDGGGACEPPTPAFPRRFLPLPAWPATPEGLRAAHSSPVPFVQDGLYLLHREAHYTPGQTPLALVWKDAACSHYLLDTDLQGQPLAQQQVTLEYRMDASVATADPQPVVLGRMPAAFVAGLGPALRPGKLLRFAIGPGGIQFYEGQPVGADLHFLGPANQRRGRADSCSKIVFQHLCRTQPITLEQLLEAAAAGAGPASSSAALAPPCDGTRCGQQGQQWQLGGSGSMSCLTEGVTGMEEVGATDGIEVDGPG